MALFELTHQVGNHATRHLVDQHAGVDHRHLMLCKVVPVLGSRIFQGLTALQEEIQIETRIPVRSKEGCHDGFHRGLRGSQCKGGQAGVHNVHPRLDRFKVNHGGHPAGVVGMEVNGDLDHLLEFGDELGDVEGCHDPGHVFETERVGAHGLDFFGFGKVVLEVEHLAAHPSVRQRVADGPLEVLPIGFDPLHHGLKVTEVVDCVKNSEDIHPRFRSLVHEKTSHIIGIVPVAHQVLTPEEHGERGFLDVLLQGLDSLKGVFPQKAVQLASGGRTVQPGWDGETAFPAA